MAQDKKHVQAYTAELKLAAVLSVTEDGFTYRQAAEEHGVASVSTLKKWLIAYRREGAEALERKPMGRPKNIHSPIVNRMPPMDELLLRMENEKLAHKLGRR